MRIHIDERSVTVHVDFLFVGEKNFENVSFSKNCLYSYSSRTCQLLKTRSSE